MPIPDNCNCDNLQRLAELIEAYSMNIETSQKTLQKSHQLRNNRSDPPDYTDGETPYLELNNSRLQKADIYPSQLKGFESRGVIQCFQCNQFNHGRTLPLTPKCPKCGENHQSRDCKIKMLDTRY
ncbi:hypothetical protein TNCV_1098141 [Trichonephila clavipes]|nr:hypothetical protein TNCV_1098141 [Trichonephila clavipes]